MKGTNFFVLLVLLLVFTATFQTQKINTANNSATDAFTTIFSTGVLWVGADTTYAPFKSINSTTNMAQGFDVDLANYIDYELSPTHNITAQIITSQ